MPRQPDVRLYRRELATASEWSTPAFMQNINRQFRSADHALRAIGRLSPGTLGQNVNTVSTTAASFTDLHTYTVPISSIYASSVYWFDVFGSSNQTVAETLTIQFTIDGTNVFQHDVSLTGRWHWSLQYIQQDVSTAKIISNLVRAVASSPYTGGNTSLSQSSTQNMTWAIKGKSSAATGTVSVLFSYLQYRPFV